MSEIARSVVGKLLGLGFNQEEIEYQFTGPWGKQPDLALGKAVPIVNVPGEPGMLINLRGMTEEDLAKLPRAELIDAIEKVTEKKPSGNRKNMAAQVVKLLGGG